MIRFTVDTVRVLIHVSPRGVFEDLSDWDQEVVGSYSVDVSAKLDKESWADAALDAFHGSIAVDDEDALEFLVEDSQGSLLIGSQGHLHASLMDEAELV